MRLPLLVLGLLALFPALAGAVPMGAVEAVQPPAWIDRGQRSVPLALGTELQTGDVVRTGEGGRAYLRLAEGSVVKLGESARMALYSRSLDPKRRLKAALDLGSGAFRFTTDTVGRATGRRDLTIRVVTATIGIRGTDVWGRADPERDLVALIEGQIELSRRGEALAITPMTYLDAPLNGVAEIKPLPPELLSRLARQTEIAPGDGAVRRGGPWMLVREGLSDQAAALELYDQLRELGVAVRIVPQRADTGWRYRLQLDGFADQTEAAVLAARIKAAGGPELSPSRPER